MKTKWFGLVPIIQSLRIYKNIRKVEKTNKASDLNKDNDKDTYEIRRDHEKTRQDWFSNWKMLCKF